MSGTDPSDCFSASYAEARRSAGAPTKWVEGALAGMAAQQEERLP